MTIYGNILFAKLSDYTLLRKFKIRQMIESKPLLLHIMLKQGQTWYPLSKIDMMEIEDNHPESIEMCIEP